MTAERQRLFSLVLRLVGPVLLVVVLWRIDDPRALWAAISEGEAWPLVAALLLNAVPLHLKVERWRVLMRVSGYEYPLGRAYVAFLASLYLGMITPGRVGDALRVQYTRHEVDMPYADGLAVSVMDRLCDMYVLLAFVAMGVVHFASLLTGELASLTWAAVALTALAPLVLLIPGWGERLTGAVYRRVSKRQHPEGFTRFFAALRAQVGKGLWVALPLTLVSFVVNYLQGWLVARSIHLDISFFEVTCLIAVASLLSLLPFSVAGVGVREAFLALVFPALGLTAEQGVAFGMLVLVVIYVALALAGFVVWQIAPPPVAVRR